jgi:hypothetical protein
VARRESTGASGGANELGPARIRTADLSVGSGARLVGGALGAGGLGMPAPSGQIRPPRTGGSTDSRHESRPPDLLDDRVWSLLGQDRQEAGPVEQTEAVNQADRAVAEYGRSVQALAGNGVDQGVLGGGRVDAATQNVAMVAVRRWIGSMAEGCLNLERAPLKMLRSRAA